MIDDGQIAIKHIDYSTLLVIREVKITMTSEVEIRRIEIQGQPRQKKFMRSHLTQ
jgi:hypothetical protein